MASTHSPAVKLPVVVIQDPSSTENDIHQKKRAKTSPITPRILHPNSNKLLDNMLYPLTRDDFLKHHFRKDAVHISRNQSSNASELVSDISNNYLFGLDTSEIFTETSSENVFLWLRPPSSDTASSTLNSVEISDPDTAYALHISGRHSAYCRAPPILEQHLVGSLLQATGLGGGHYAPHSETVTLGGNTTLGRGEVELFIADGDDNNKRDDIKQHTTGWHTDFQENFTIQISGIKKWTLRRGRVMHPLRATTPHYARDASVVENQLKVARLSCLGGNATANDTTFENSYGFEYNDNNAVGEEQVVTLYPGDCFYFPSGMWHTVETIEPGISLNVSLMGTTYAQLVSESLQHLLSQREGWREVVTSRPGDNEETGSIHLQGLLSGLSQVVDDFVNKQGGAQSILPPALCHPPPPLDREGEDEAEDESSNTDSECKEDNSSSSDEKNEAMNDQKMDHMSDNDEDEENDSPVSRMIISIDNFEGPAGWSSSQPQNSKLIKNPLACLIAMSDIDSDDDKQKQQRGVKQYVLNVNYCGNDMMESHIRVILEATSPNIIDQMDWYLECEAKGLDAGQLFNSSNGNASTSSRYLPPPQVLFYFGYFSWTS